MSRFHLLLASACLVLAACSKDKPQDRSANANTAPKEVTKVDPKEELKLLVGTWRILSADFKGEPKDIQDRGLVIEADGAWKEVSLKKQAPEPLPDAFLEDKVVVIGTTASPREIDIITKTTFPADVKALPTRAIYKLEGDKLTICLGQAGKRPKDFESGQLFVFERQK